MKNYINDPILYIYYIYIYTHTHRHTHTHTHTHTLCNIGSGPTTCDHHPREPQREKETDLEHPHTTPSRQSDQQDLPNRTQSQNTVQGHRILHNPRDYMAMHNLVDQRSPDKKSAQQHGQKNAWDAQYVDC